MRLVVGSSESWESNVNQSLRMLVVSRRVWTNKVQVKSRVKEIQRRKSKQCSMQVFRTNRNKSILSRRSRLVAVQWLWSKKDPTSSSSVGSSLTAMKERRLQNYLHACNAKVTRLLSKYTLTRSFLRLKMSSVLLDEKRSQVLLRYWSTMMAKS